MKKRILLMCAVLCLALVLQLPAAYAADAEGQTGSFTWSLNGGELTISGEGVMPDYPEGAPWDAYREQITKVVFTGGVTYVGAYAFKDYDALKSIDFGDSLYELGKQSFYSCDGLTVLQLPESFKVFGEESLRHCAQLKEIHSEGRFPSFRLNCLWDTKVIIYYPASRPWGLQYIQQMEEVFKGRIEFLASDGSDPYDPDAVTTEATTVPETTEATTVPETTVPETTAPEVTVPEQTQPTQSTQGPREDQTQPTLPQATQPPQEEDGAPGAAWIWLVIAVFFALLAMTIPSFLRPKRRKKRRNTGRYQ